MEKIRKHLNYIFLNVSETETPEWARCRTSTDFSIANNATTETFDYIADENPTDELKSYKPTIGQTQTAYIGDKVYDFIYSKFYGNAVGTEAITDAMIVFQQKDTGDANKAWKSEALITVETYDLVAGTITYTIGLRGTIAKGTATVDEDETPVFTVMA